MIFNLVWQLGFAEKEASSSLKTKPCQISIIFSTTSIFCFVLFLFNSLSAYEPYY